MTDPAGVGIDLNDASAARSTYDASSGLTRTLDSHSGVTRHYDPLTGLMKTFDPVDGSLTTLDTVTGTLTITTHDEVTGVTTTIIPATGETRVYDPASGQVTLTDTVLGRTTIHDPVLGETSVYDHASGELAVHNQYTGATTTYDSAGDVTAMRSVSHDHLDTDPAPADVDGDFHVGGQSLQNEDSVSSTSAWPDTDLPATGPDSEDVDAQPMWRDDFDGPPDGELAVDWSDDGFQWPESHHEATVPDGTEVTFDTAIPFAPDPPQDGAEEAQFDPLSESAAADDMFDEYAYAVPSDDFPVDDLLDPGR